MSSRAYSASPDPDSDDLRGTFETIVTGADLSVTKTGADDGTPAVGEQITYSIVASNAGPAVALNVRVSDTLPTGVTFVSASGSGTHAGGVVSWAAIPTLAVGADTTLTVVVTISQTVDLVNKAVVTSDTGDPHQGEQSRRLPHPRTRSLSGSLPSEDRSR